MITEIKKALEIRAKSKAKKPVFLKQDGDKKAFLSFIQFQKFRGLRIYRRDQLLKGHLSERAKGRGIVAQKGAYLNQL